MYILYIYRTFDMIIRPFLIYYNTHLIGLCFVLKQLCLNIDLTLSPLRRLSYYHIVTLSYHHIVTLSYCHIITTLAIVILSHCHIVTAQAIVIFSHCHIVTTQAKSRVFCTRPCKSCNVTWSPMPACTGRSLRIALKTIMIIVVLVE